MEHHITEAQAKRNLKITLRQQDRKDKEAKKREVNKLEITRKRYGVNSIGAALAAKGLFL